MAQILIIDDDPQLCEILELLLGEHEHEVSSVQSLAGFNQVLSGTPPDVVLLDLNLPDVNGLELLPRIKIIWPSTVVGIITGIDDYRVEDLLFEAGGRSVFHQTLPRSGHRRIHRTFPRRTRQLSGR